MSRHSEVRGGGSTDIPQIKEIPLCYQSIESHLKYTQGRILTIIDACIVDKEQKRSIKDLINGEITQQLNWLYDLTHEGVRSLGDREMCDVVVPETVVR